MENNNSIEEFEDALSLCDFALCDQESSIEHPDSPSSQEEDFFEFSTSSTSSVSNSTADNIIFCGKIISCKTENDDNDQRYNNPLCFSSSPSLRMVNRNKITSKNSSSKPALPPPARSSSSKKHKVIIGLTRIPSKMELSDLRERQNRKLQTPPPMFPAVVGSEAAAVSGGGSSKRSRNWSLLRRAQYMVSTLTRSSSFGGLRLARPCID
ncbi:conserved hypothetical protein [Ricinus communis]|uniref:Uncharacterized protein n=1 Tax=Ricinus communis TaxID=3988 RepID=B9SUQ0_RICCO|nr:conserved hypothetical protein [Ricinus communis]|eukprot:XP_025014970.1 uncharacterized protein LOC112536453 [Ricinus communis]